MDRGSLLDKLHIDWGLLLAIFSCFGLGMMVLYSAKLDVSVLNRQLIRILIATSFMLLAAQIPTRIYREWAPALYFITLAMLAMVLNCRRCK